MTGARHVYTFDRFRVDPLQRVLSYDGQPVAIMPKAFSALLVLLERAGEVVPKDELIEKLWPGTVVTEASLSQAIFWLRKSLGEKAGDRRFVITIPGQGYSFGAGVTELPAEDEPAVADAAPEAPVATPQPEPAPVAIEVKRAPRRAVALAAGLAAVLVAVAGFSIWFASWRGERAASVRAAVKRPVVAVLGFKNLSGKGEAAWLSTALTEMLTTELAAGARVRVIPGDVVSKTRISLSVPYGGELDPQMLERLHTTLGADQVVAGSYLWLPGAQAGGERIRLDLRVLDAKGGDIAASLTEEGNEPELLTMVSRMGSRLRRSMNLGDLSPAEQRAALATQPSNPAAAKLYAEGLAALRRFDPLTARDRLERAVEADPNSAPVRSALSEAWAALGYDAKAANEASKSLALATGLPREDRLLIEARNYEASRQWSKASERYRSLFAFYPDDLEFGLRLASTLGKDGKGKDALEVIAGLRRLPAPTGQDARIDLEEAWAASSLADYDLQRRAAEAAATKASEAGSKGLHAMALMVEAAAVRVVGKRTEALKLLDIAREECGALGDRACVADALSTQGLIARELGDLAGAEKLYDQSLATFRGLGYQRSIATTLSNLGVLHLYRGELDEARALLGQARATYVEIGDPVGEAGVLSSIVSLHGMRGDYPAALRDAERVLAIGRSTGNRANEASGLYQVGTIFAEQGELKLARSYCEKALAILGELKDRSKAAAYAATLAGFEYRTGAGDAARKRAEQALADKREAGDRVGIASVIGSLAPILAESGALGDAERLVEEGLGIAREARIKPLLAVLLHSRGQLLLARGNLSEARAALDDALAIRIALGQAVAADATRIELARVALASGHAADAATLAGPAAEAARARQQAPAEAMARAVLADAQLAGGDAAAALRTSEQARVLSERGDDRLMKLRVAIEVARVQLAASANAAPLVETISKASDEAQRSGFERLAIESRCTAGQAALVRGDATGARTLIDRARTDATARGFAQLAATCGVADRSLTARR